jgi:hypothetical protein
MASTLAVAGNVDFNGDLDVDGTTNLDIVDIDGAVDMASTALVTGVLTTTAATVFNGGFASNAASTISTADNLDTLSLISTDADANSGPNLRLYRNSGSPADSDVLGHIQYEGRNDNSQDVVYSEILTLAADVSDGTEDAIVYIQSMVAGTVRERISILPSETVFNENSVDLDFRVESDNDANALFVQGSDGFVGIGTASPSRKLHISSSGTDCAIRLDNTVSERPFLLAYDDSQNLTFTNSSDSGYIAFVNGTGAGTERVRIDSSGNLLVGGTTTTTIPTLNKGIYLVSPTDGDVIGYSLYANEGTNNRRASFFLNDSNGVYGFDTTASSGVCDFVVQSAGTERMRVESGGNLCLGSTTSAAKLRVNYTGESYGLRVGTTATSGVAVQFVYEPSDQVGTITNTTSATAYNTSSDYRLKEDDVPMTGATERVKALRPINFAWKIDGSRVDGFFAHEAQEVVPEAVHGTKDAMRDEEYEVTPAVLDDDGNVVTEAVMGTRSVPDMQGIDHSKLVPLLTAALQEAITKIENLTTRLETLENA